MRIYNFNAGPAALPTEVLEQARDELLDWRGAGMSIMEMSHRGKHFTEVATEAEKDLRDLMQIPANYKVLFLQGGARLQFAMVPINLLRGKTTADYLDTGVWSKLAAKEAQKFCDVNLVASSESSGYKTIPEENSWKLNPTAAYFHFCSNETVNGTEFQIEPHVRGVPLVADMSSNILSRPIDVSKYGLIYAGAQKNIGPAGITVVIVREDLLGGVLPKTPIMLDYKTHADNESMYNTPPTFAWYLSGLVFKWLKKQGGLEAIAAINKRKAQKFYNFIDSSKGFYRNDIDKKYRSTMSAVFFLADEKLNEVFLKESNAAGFAGLKGHKLVGGMRASLYNAVPEKAVDDLIVFMSDFAKKNS